MNGSNVLGIIFSETQPDSKMPELNANRTVAALPFGGKYRLIDFPVSDMVNSGIDKIGVVIKNNYHSLIAHLGSGKSWGLSRRRGGLILLPPFLNSTRLYGNYLQTLYSIRDFIEDCTEEYVLLTDCDVIYNIDYGKMFNEHIKNNADITLLYRTGSVPKCINNPMLLSLDGDDRINDIKIMCSDLNKETEFALNTTLISRKLLIDLINEAVSCNKLSFKRDVLQSNVGKLNIYGYRFDGFCAFVNDVENYFEANMALLDLKIQDELFNPKRPVYTMVRDDMPAKYGLSSVVKNALIAQGGVIDGEINNSVISKGVKIGKGSKISNCIIMQDTVIGENCDLSYLICDKDCVIKDNSRLSGIKTYPICIKKNSVL